MELPSNLSEQTAYYTRPKNKERMLTFMDKSTHEEHLAQPLQTNNKQIKLAVTFLTGYKGIFNVAEKNILFYSARLLTDEKLWITIPPGAYEIESLKNENKRIIFDEGHFTEADYPFQIKPNLSTLGCIVEIYYQGPLVSSLPYDSIRDLLGFKPKVLQEEYTLSDYPVNILSVDNVFFECNVAQGMIFKGKRSGIFHNFTMDDDPGYNYIEKFRGGVKCYMMRSKDILSSIHFKLKNKNNQVVSFNSQPVSFRLSIKEV